jgi:hypothetical protein
MAFGKRFRIFCGLIVIIAFSSVGCTLCSNPHDCDYVTYGSRTPRLNMKSGRVGSVLSDDSLHGHGPVETIDAIDMGYAEVLEGSETGSIFQDEPIEDADIVTIGTSGPIFSGPAR